MDTTELFDRDLFKDLIESAAAQYYNGFTGAMPSRKYPRISYHFMDKFIEKMGTDNHMEEILRINDSKQH